MMPATEATAPSEEIREELEQDVVIDILTGEELRFSEREEILQRMIRVLAAEYHFPLETMERDVPISIVVNGRKRRAKADIVIFTASEPHELSNAERIVVVQAPAVKPNDARKGVELLKDLLDAVEPCQFGVWTNGRDIAYLGKRSTPLQSEFDELSDFPGAGESLEELNRPDRRIARVAVAEDLRETILRCHDYLYGNQSMTATRAFAEMVKLIFCKIYDERQLRANSGYPRQFWVGVTERNTEDGQNAIAERIHDLFGRVRTEREFVDVFRPSDEIELRPRHLAWVVGELARYDFLNAEVDVKGMAYEAMVATTMKRERGQFFTPRNVVQTMVEMLAPEPGERILDPACGSGRFLVSCLERFREALAQAQAPKSKLERNRFINDPKTLGAGAAYARECLFGIDVDPELVRAAKMNMLINNDGHGNLVPGNSLEVTSVTSEDLLGAEFQLGSFDVVLTNPPFGAKIPVDDPEVLRGFDLGHRWSATPDGDWLIRQGELQAKMPPEILFIERCLQWLRDGGRMGIVVPDGILGNPGNEPIRAWILQHARVLASIDLPVETFQPQVGVQASLLFLEKRSRQEVNAGIEADYPIFMAIAEHVGHDRRGTTIYRRDDDGFDVFEPYEEEMLVRKGPDSVIERRLLRRRKVADDLPLVSEAYRQWNSGGIEPAAESDASIHR